jgi:WD40 repeat protein
MNAVLTIIQITSCAITPDGSKIVFKSCDNTLKVWNIEFSYELLTLKRHTNLIHLLVLLFFIASSLVFLNTILITNIGLGMCYHTR